MGATPFHERSHLGQLLVLAGMLAAAGIPVGGTILWAADVRIDEKYATDEDLKAVQENLYIQIDGLADKVERNTDASTKTARSVDALTLSILDIQIADLEADIHQLEREKRQQGAAWVESEERALREAQRRLDDLQAQRAILFQRVISPM
jgi:hypothetical protein